jgi:hypothetical protein
MRNGSYQLWLRFEVAALCDAIDVAVWGTEMHPRDILLAVPVDRSRDDGHSRPPKFLRGGCDVVGEELHHRAVVKCSFSEGANTSTLLPSDSWNTHTPSPLWLDRSPKTRSKKSAVASGFSVRVPTHPILSSLTVERLLVLIMMSVPLTKTTVRLCRRVRKRGPSWRRGHASKMKPIARRRRTGKSSGNSCPRSGTTSCLAGTPPTTRSSYRCVT